jgi:hypothetical protein
MGPWGLKKRSTTDQVWGINGADHRNSGDENTVFSVMVTMMLMLKLMLMSMMMQSCRQNYIEAGWRGMMMLMT